MIRTHERIGCSKRELGRRLGMPATVVFNILRCAEAILAEEERGGVCSVSFMSHELYRGVTPINHPQHVFAPIGGYKQALQGAQAPRPPSRALSRRSWWGGRGRRGRLGRWCLVTRFGAGLA